MDKIVASYRVYVTDVRPDNRNPKNVTLRAQLQDSEFFYLLTADAAMGITPDAWYDVRVFVKAVGYTDKSTQKVKAFLSTWVLAADLVPSTATAAA
jgi:hypothetical protein